MAKKSSLLLAGVAVLAFAVPAMANAAVPTLHEGSEESGTLLKVGTTVLGIGSNVVITSATLGEIKCQSIVLEGDLSVNNTTNGITIFNIGQPSPPTTDCTNGTNTVNVTEVTLEDLVSTVGGVAKASFTADLLIGASTRCTYTATNVKGTYTNGSSVLTFSGATGITGEPAACGTAKLDGSFTQKLTSGRLVSWRW